MGAEAAAAAAVPVVVVVDAAEEAAVKIPRASMVAGEPKVEKKGVRPRMEREGEGAPRGWSCCWDKEDAPAPAPVLAA